MIGAEWPGRIQSVQQPLPRYLRRSGSLLARAGMAAVLADWFCPSVLGGKRRALAKRAVAGERADGMSFDNPSFIDRTLEFFLQNYRSITYETFFDGPDHAIFKAKRAPVNPISSAKYLELYGGRV
jgi:hypothetical protein